MVFTSFEFVFFFLLVIALRGFLSRCGADKWFLLVASGCFILTWSLPCTLLILLTSSVDFLIGKKLGQSEDPGCRKRLLLISLCSNLGILGFFKYTNFLLENVCLGLSTLGLQVSQPHIDINLPPAISYFTFASLSYVLDVYYERLMPCMSLRDYALFIAYFPKLLAGPIARARLFLPQLAERVRANALDIETGLAYFMVGAVKKLAISDQIAGHVNLIFRAPGQYDGLTLLQGLLGYAVQIYCDFSGYSDMAIGCARIMGFQLPENFQMPYASVTITEFWRRWHMTLSGWFRDYVFMPIEVACRSNPNPTLRASISVMVTMLLCGLWHGASWNFVLWGGIHGAALAIHRFWTSWNPLGALKDHRLLSFFWSGFSRLLTLGVVLLGWVFFRAESFQNALVYFGRMISWSHGGTRMVSPYILPAVVGVVAAHLLLNKDRNWMVEIPLRSMPIRIACYTALAVLLVCLGATDSVPFIYFQF